MASIIIKILDKGYNVVVCFPAAKIEAVPEMVEKIMGPGKGGFILVHVGTNNTERGRVLLPLLRNRGS